MQKFYNPPLVFVLAQVAVNPVANIANFIAAIQERLRQMTFTDFAEYNAPNLTFDRGDVTLVNKTLWCFSNRTRRTAVIINLDAIVVQTSEYEDFDSFSALLTRVVSQVDDVVKYQTRRRLGLRYVNRLSRSPLQIHESVTGGDFDPFHLKRHKRSESILELEKGGLAVRFSDFPEQSVLPLGIDPFAMDIGKAEHLKNDMLLDLDRYDNEEQDFDLLKIKLDLQQFNNDVLTAFLAATTPEAHLLWDKVTDA